MADIASGGNSQLQLKGAAQLAKVLRQAGADLKDLRGRLAKSIRAGATQKAGVVRAGNNGKVKYAGVINYGWPKHNIKATMFANKAAKNTEPQWTQLYADAVQKIINRITTGD